MSSVVGIIQPASPISPRDKSEGGTDCPPIGWHRARQRVGTTRSTMSSVLRLCDLWRCSWCQSTSGRTLVLRTAKAENREENNSQKKQPDPETCPFTKAFGQVDTKNYTDDKVHKRDQQQKDPPGGSADYFAPNINIIDRDDAGPTWLAGLGEDFPPGCQHQNREG